jgi:hypothetical protein
MADLDSGALLFWSFPYLLSWTSVSVFAIILLRISLPRSFAEIGYVRLLTGSLALYLVIAIGVGTQVANGRDVKNMLLITFPIIMLSVAFIFAPVIVGLEAIKKHGILIFGSIIVSVVSVLILLIETQMGPTVYNGLSRWIKSMPYIVPALCIAATVFWLGVRKFTFRKPRT